MKTITIDPGHGGSDPGAVNGTRYEKNDNLRLGLALRDKLQQLGQKVVMTRDTDTYVGLLDRSIIANDNNTDLFISLHRNASTNPAVHGVANYVQVNTPPRTTEYAESVLDRVVDAGVSRNIGVLQENFSVLRNTRAPAQLLELGFVSNEDDNELFDRNFDAYVNAIAYGILDALGETPPPPVPTPPPSAVSPAVIKQIQQTLNSRYGSGLSADGIFGSLTKRALVRGLQTELNRSYGANLTADGLFGPRTKSFIPILKRGARNNLVYILQSILYAKGYGSVPDGIYGPATEAAVRRFQQDSGLYADGIAGPNTFEALFK